MGIAHAGPAKRVQKLYIVTIPGTGEPSLDADYDHPQIWIRTTRTRACKEAALAAATWEHIKDWKDLGSDPKGERHKLHENNTITVYSAEEYNSGF